MAWPRDDSGAAAASASRAAASACSAFSKASTAVFVARVAAERCSSSSVTPLGDRHGREPGVLAGQNGDALGGGLGGAERLIAFGPRNSSTEAAALSTAVEARSVCSPSFVTSATSPGMPPWRRACSAARRSLASSSGARCGPRESSSRAAVSASSATCSAAFRFSSSTRPAARSASSFSTPTGTRRADSRACWVAELLKLALGGLQLLAPSADQRQRLRYPFAEADQGHLSRTGDLLSFGRGVGVAEQFFTVGGARCSDTLARWFAFIIISR